MTLSHATTNLVQDVTRPLRELQPLGRAELLKAHRQGRDLHTLIEDWWAQYEQAFAEAERIVFELADELGVAPCEVAPGAIIDYAATIGPPSRWSFVVKAELGRFEKRVRNTAPAPTLRHRPVAAPRERRAGSSSRTSSADPGDSDPEQDDGLALGFVDRAPFLWRFRHLRCRLLEIREGVDR